ncbi:MAG: hypothetical protein IT379_40670 [Deltaproteobacteria bacterium]|nr:hypothetical protein [Deltaproteobacteria bacterium]
MVARMGLLLALGLASAACSDHHDAGEAPEGVIYGEGVSDEAWVAIGEAPLVTDDASAPRLVRPTALPRSGPPPTFEWEAGAIARIHVPRRSRSARTRGLLAELFGVSVARAHLPPVTGAVFRLVLDLEAGEPVRVLTKATTWTPDEATWSRIVGASGPIGVELVGTYLDSNRVTEGPFVSSQPASLTFEE